MLNIEEIPKEILEFLHFIITERTGYKKTIQKTIQHVDEYGKQVKQDIEYNVFYRPTDRAILEKFNSVQKENGFPVMDPDLFYLFVETYEKAIEGFPKENKPLTQKELQGEQWEMGSIYPNSSGSELERLSGETSPEGKIHKKEKRVSRYPEMNPKKANDYQKHLEKYNQPCLLYYRGRLGQLCPTLGEAELFAKSRNWTHFTVYSTRVMLNWDKREDYELLKVINSTTES